MHSIVYNFYNYKNIYNDILSKLDSQKYDDEKFTVNLVWTYETGDDLNNIVTCLNEFNLKKIKTTFLKDTSFAESRNMGIFSVLNSTNPIKYITLLEDDHYVDFNELQNLEMLMEKYWGKRILDNLKVGMFSLCLEHCNSNLIEIEKNIYIPNVNEKQFKLGGLNSCFRSAPVSHFLKTLGGYALDEYPISFYQTNSQNIKNYNSGYTVMYLDSKKEVVHPEADYKSNSLGGITVWNKFNPIYSRSHLDALNLSMSEGNRDKQKEIPINELLRMLFKKISKKIYLKK